MRPLGDRFGSLKARMALVLGLVLVLPAAYAMLQTVRVYTGQSARDLGTLRGKAELISKFQREALEQSRSLLEQLAAQLPPGANTLCPQRLGEELAKRGDRFHNLVVVAADGGGICATSPYLLGDRFTDRDWYKEAKEHGVFTVSGVLLGRDPATGRTMVLAMPIEGARVLAASLLLSRFATIPTGSNPDAVVAYLVDGAGEFLSEIDPRQLSLPGRPEIARLLKAPETQSVLVDGPSGRLQFVAAPVAEGRIYALVGLPSPRWSWLERDLVLGLIAPVLMLGLAVICIWIATDYLVNRHIHALAFAARDYARSREAAWPSMAGAPTELKELARTLSQATRELDARETELKASLAQKEALVREIHHRVKNNLQVVTSLLNLRARAATSPDARLAMVEAQSRIKALALVHRDLHEGEQHAAVELSSLLRELASLIEDTAGSAAGEVEVTFRLEPVQVSLDQAVPVTLLVAEALSNAFKHAFPRDEAGKLGIELTRIAPESARLVVADNGIGLGEPTAGLGLTLMRMLAGQSRGELRIGGSDGTRIELLFPVLAPAGTV